MPKRFTTILTHIAVWVAFLSLPALVAPRSVASFPPPVEPPPERALFFVALNLVLIGFFYFNYALLIPRLLARGRRKPYFASIGGVFVSVLSLAGILHLFLGQSDGLARQPFWQSVGPFITTMLFGLSWAASSGIRLSTELARAERRRRDSENARLNTELAQLKSQLNPHFLFNTLNGIYALTLAQSALAPDAVLRLSQLLRYVMAETNVDWVPLKQDIDHLQHFIELSQLRLSSHTPVTFRLEGNPDDRLIAPLLLLPFVENAFKFGSSTRAFSPIDITLRIGATGLEFSCENCLRNRDGDSTGIGIANTRRRLELLYPGRYRLETGTYEERYRAFLQINLLNGTH